MKALWSRAFITALALTATSAIAAPAPLAGRPVAELLNDAIRSGIRLVYSSQSIPGDLPVIAEPLASEPVERLREILKPHGLVLTPMAGSVWVVTRAPARPVMAAIHAEPLSAEQSVPLPELTVTGSRYALQALTIDASLGLSDQELAAQPGLADDPVRAIRRFPGTAGTIYSSKTHVRGGEDNENEIRLDGVPLIDPFRRVGQPADLSLINAAIVDRIEFYPGVFPANYGGRLSSVTSITSRRATRPFGGQLDLGFITAAALLEGQWAGAEGDWQIAARRSTLDLLAHAVEPDLGKPKLIDVFTSAHWPVRPGWLASVGLLSALDETAVAETDGSESSETEAHRLQSWFGLDGRIGAISLQTRIAFNSSDTNRMGQIRDEDGANGTLLDRRGVKSVLLLQDALLPLGDTVLRFGWQGGYSDVAYDYRKAVTFTEKATTLYGVPEEQNFVIDADTGADEQAAYIAAQWSPATQLTADVGLRGERRKYDSGQQVARLDPRLSLLYRPARRMAWRLSWGTFTQLASAAELPVDRELSRFDRPERSSLWVLGWDYAFGPQQTLRLELYDRRTRHPWPHLESLIDPLVLVPELRPDQVLVAPRHGHSWGADLYWSGWLSDRWRGWMSYSYSHAVDTFDGGHVSRSWDQRHAFVAALTTDRLGWGWTAMFTAHSGWPTTPGTVIDDELVLGRRNAARLGGYVTLDLKAQREVRMQRGTLRLTAELTNATDRRNPCCSSFEFGGDGEPPIIDQHQWLPLLPLLSMSWQF